MADLYALLEEGFRQGLSRVLADKDLDRLLESVPDPELLHLGQVAAKHALAPLVWRASVGDVLETEQVRELLGVSRQAIAQRVERGTLLGLRGERTTLFPAWQFDGRGVRSCVAEILAAFRDRLGEDFDPLLIASWARTPQPELDDETADAWLSAGRNEAAVGLAASRAAGALAR